MGLINNLLGLSPLVRDIGGTIKDTTEVFHVNETEEMRLNAERQKNAMEQLESETENESSSFFGKQVDALNRLPRPMMALGTIGLFGFALYDPARFSVRMEGLQEVPDQLWWLMGAIVSFYFGARELHYARIAKTKNIAKAVAKNALKTPKSNVQKVDNAQPVQKTAQIAQPKTSDNPAIRDWLETQNT